MNKQLKNGIRWGIRSILLATVLPLFSQTPAQLLETAYKHKSKEELKAFFLRWNRDIPPVTEAELAGWNDTIRQAYRVFAAFYMPHRLDRLGGSEWGNDLYRDVDFLIVQNDLCIYQVDKILYTDQELQAYIADRINRSSYPESEKRERLKLNAEGKFFSLRLDPFLPFERLGYPKEEYRRVDSLAGFRPAIRCDGKIPVYLTPEYEEILNDFLDNQRVPFSRGVFMSPARQERLVKKRKEFLENSVLIFHGHWGGYWQLHSYPRITALFFNRDLTEAKVFFRMVYQGGEALLKREGDGWTLIRSKLTWIE